MKKYAYIIICLILFLSCEESNKKRINSELTFKSISFTNLHGANDKQFKKFTKEIDSILAYNTDKNSDIVKLYTRFKKLEEHNLIRAPYIFLKSDNDSTITVFLSENEYKKVNHFKKVKLYNEKKRVFLELEIEEKDEGIYFSDNIISINKIDN